MKRNERMEPAVFFSVAWPDGTPADGVFSWVDSMLRINAVYAQGVAEIARRNGGGGFLRVEVLDEPHSLDVDGQAFRGTTARAQWHRGGLGITPGRAADVLKRGPTQTAFTVQYRVAVGAGGVLERCTRFEGTQMHAAALKILEARGLNENVCCIAAMDGGECNGTTLEIKPEAVA